MPRTDYPVLDGNGNVIIQNPYDPALPYLNLGGASLAGVRVGVVVGEQV